jgi:hypothetical protein
MGDCAGENGLLQVLGAADLTRWEDVAIEVYDFGEFQTT